MSNILSIFSMIAAFGIAIALDSLTGFLQSQVKHTFNPNLLILGETAANLVFGALLITFAWLVLIRLERNNLKALILILVGALITLYWPLLTLRFDILGPITRGSVLYPVHTTLMDLGPGSFLVMTGAYTLIVGLIDIFGLQRLAFGRDRRQA